MELAARTRIRRTQRGAAVAALAAACFAFDVRAEQVFAVASNGDCRDPELVAAARMMTRALATQQGIKVIDEDAIHARVGGGPTRSVEEIQRQIDTARQQFYQAQYFKAVSTIESALDAIQRLPPGDGRWQLWLGARTIEGLIRSRVKRDMGADDAFRMVLRLEPTYQLDRDYYGPSTLQLFEKIRKEVAQAKKHRVQVTSSPVGADVFLDGRLMGKTPYKEDLLPGKYQLVVAKGDSYSLPREVEIGATTDLHVDLKFEGAIDTSRGVCIQTAPDEDTRLRHAAKLGSVLDADQLVVVRFDRPKVGPVWLASTLVAVDRAAKIREGGLEIGADGITESGMAELARFVATGETSPRVRTTPVMREPAPSASTEAAAPTPEMTATTSAWMPYTNRTIGMTLMGSGGAAIVAGGVLQVLAAGNRAEADELSKPFLRIDDAPRVRALLDAAGAQTTIGIVALGVGAASAGVGAWLFFNSPADEAAPGISFVPLAGGGSIVASGIF